MATYAVTDLHGKLDLYKQIKAFLKPEDVVYYLGDAGDRGPEPWQTIVEIYNDPQFIYLKGNHEDMLTRAMDEWIPEHYHGHNFSLLYNNGGRKTFQEWKDGPERNKWYAKLCALPIKKEYINKDGMRVIMTHAGFSPNAENTFCWGDDLIWNREHFYEPWDEGDGCKNIIILHGHTPFPYMMDAYDVEDPLSEGQVVRGDKKVHAIWYCEHHKCCLDMGAVFLGQTIMIDLDTWEEHWFGCEEEEN